MDKASASLRKSASLRSEGDFRSLADQAPSLLWAIDTKLNLIYANKQTLEYAGLHSVEEYTRKEWLGLTHPDDYDYMVRTSEYGIKHKKAYCMEIRAREAKTGDYHWLLIKSAPYYSKRGKLLAFVGMAINIDEFKEAETELADSEQEFSQIFNQTSVGISKTDFKGNYVLVNQRYAEIVGRSTKELLKLTIRDTTHPDDYNDILKTRQYVLKTGQKREVERRYVRPDGTVVWTSLSSTVMTDAHGKPRYMLSMAQDITERKLAQEGLYAREQQLEAIVNQATAGIMQTDLDGRFIFVNPGYCEIVGRSPEELYGMNLIDITHPDDVPSTKSRVKKLLKDGQDYTTRKRYSRPDGSYIWVRNNVTVIRNEEGEAVSILAVSVNIDEQERATTALQASEEKLRLATEAGKVGAWEWDISTDTITWSDELHRIYGLDVGTFDGGLENKLSLIHPDDKAMMTTTVRQAVKAGTDYEAEFRIFRADGKIRWVIERGRVHRNETEKAVRITGTAIDITERKLVQEALKESEERLRFMAESMPQKVFTAKPNGDIDYLNPQWSTFSGLPFHQLLDQGWTNIIHPDDLIYSIKRWNNAVQTGEPYECEQRLLRHDGVYRWHISRAQAMRDEQGNIIRWFGSNTDIDDIKNTARRYNELENVTVALKKQRSELVHLNQAKDEFISLASHQLRTPASAVKQFLGMTLEGYAEPLTDTQRQLIARANESNERQIAVINDLLKVAQVDAGKVQLNYHETDLVSLIQHVLDDQASVFASRKQKVSFIHKEPQLMVHLDSDRLRMVIDNLIDNASKYTHVKKSIDVRAAASKGMVMISIKDQGVGIRKHELRRLFHKFTRLDNPLSVLVGGTGLGLYWAKKIVELHGGSIQVESELNKGSTFTIVLPIDPSQHPNITNLRH